MHLIKARHRRHEQSRELRGEAFLQKYHSLSKLEDVTVNAKRKWGRKDISEQPLGTTQGFIVQGTGSSSIRAGHLMFLEQI